ncbi:MAG: VOC family protein, partial [Verrucomicrobia bacterium]|nr:VOC family protein [Verrucomicrobiota bacterium]
MLLGLFAHTLTSVHALGAEPTNAAPPPPRVLGLSHVAVKATDYEGSVAFYRDFLGFAEQGRLFDLKNGRRQLVFLKINDTQSIEVFDAANVTQVAGNLYQIALQIEDAEAMRLHLQRHGFKVPPKAPLGQMLNANFMVRDPNNYIIELVHYLPEGRMVLDRGKFLSGTRISDRLVAAGVATTRLPETLRFFGEIFGFPQDPPRAGPDSGEPQRRLRAGANGDYVEVLVAPQDDTPFFRLEVRDLDSAKAQLERSPFFPNYGRPIAIQSGPSRARAIHLWDP